MLNRRKLLASAASFALMCGQVDAQIMLRVGTRASYRTDYGAMSAGGFYQGIDISDDGVTMVINYDGGNAWIWDSANNRWQNMFEQDRVPVGSNQAIWGQGNTGGGAQLSGLNCPSIAVAPSDNNRIYAAVRTISTGANPGPTQIWRSNNRGETWIDTGKWIGLTTSVPRGMGRTMAVDPNNPDHVLISDDAGAIWRTTDGFQTLTCLNATGGPLAGILPTAVATATTAQFGTVLTVGNGNVPAAVSSPPAGQSRWASDVSDNSAFKISALVSATTASTITVNAIPGTGVEIGDTFVFGMRAGITFDRTSSVVGGITQGLFIGWGYGASAIYRTVDGCASFSSMSGSPTTSKMLECSWDGVLYVLSYLPNSGANAVYRYQSSAWTTLTAFINTNTFDGLATDPLNPGHVCVVRASGGLLMSGNYGASVNVGAAVYDANYNNTRLPRTSTDAPWMGPFVIPTGVSLSGTVDNSMSHGQCKFDPTVSGRLWIAEGTGIWYGAPPVSGGGTTMTVPLTGRNKNAQTIIINGMVKPSGGPLLVSIQDRGGAPLPDPTVEPTGDFGFWETGPTAALASGWSIDYAKNDNNFLLLTATGGVWKSVDGGLLWSRLTSSTISGVGSQGQCAVQTANSFVVVGLSGGMFYTTDGGTTFSDCLFNGSPLTTGWQGFFWERRIVCADLVNTNTYYAYNINANASGGGLWRSTDGGANWTKMSNLITRAGGSVVMNTGAVNWGIQAIPGNEGHLLISPGNGFTNNFAAMWSVDAGATWVAIPGSGVTWMVSAGKEVSPGAYPAVIAAGFNANDPSPNDPGVFICNDLDPNNTAKIVTWTRLSRAPAKNLTPPKVLCADKDVYGKWYMAMGGNGYTYGQLVA